MVNKRIKSFLSFVIIFSVSSIILSACGKVEPATSHAYSLAEESQLPELAENLSPEVREAYLFAIENPDILIQFPCYCGCGAMGHMNNLDCYIEEFNPDGSIVFDYHAFG